MKTFLYNLLVLLGKLWMVFILLSAEESIQFLIDNGFKIVSIGSNDGFDNEVNIHFEKNL